MDIKTVHVNWMSKTYIGASLNCNSFSWLTIKPVCNCSLYGVLPLEDTGFLQFKCEQDYMCSSEPNSGDPGDSVPFLSLIEKLIKSSLALV